MAVSKESRRNKIRTRIRATISGTTTKPRLAVFRSNKDIYVQLIDDLNGSTLVAASSKEVSGSKMEQANSVGKSIAEKAMAAGITEIVFDRGGYLYHGRIKALAEGARESGLKF
ncbi:MAG: 50S ribosomal protein L18 [Flavobacteriales bacterium]|mgnify:FL=1|jgi:large subunit ribosomal protein L18|tara:strand:- start:12880 stop:13221 length:342 start_codon:yes stop_codon:yes gene_type:complete